MKKGRVEWLAAALVVLVMGIVLIFVLFTTISPHGYNAEIELPDDSVFDSVADTQQRPQEPGDHAELVKVTTQNVQKVIETLSRPDAYYIKTESIVSYADESRVTICEQWLSPGRCVTRETDSLSAKILCSVTDRSGVTLWYEGENQVVSSGAGSFLQQDRLAGIPTYESVLELEINDLITADYRTWEAQNCIYVETYDSGIGYTMRYYVSVDSGMLVRAETYSQGELVYSMNLLEFSEDVSEGEAIQPPR